MTVDVDLRHLAEENAQVLNLLQALLGTISPNMRAISLEWHGGSGRLYVVLEHENADDREEISDVAFAFQALQDRDIPLEVSIRVTDTPEPPSLPGRAVYRRKE